MSFFSFKADLQVAYRALDVLEVVVVVGDAYEEGCQRIFCFGGGAAAGVVCHFCICLNIAHSYWGCCSLVYDGKLIVG